MNFLFEDDAFKNMIENPSLHKLQELSEHEAIKTEYNSVGFVSNVRNRSAKNTYVVKDIELGVDQQGIEREEALKVVSQVNEYLKDKEIIKLDRQMGLNSKYEFGCRLYITKPYARIAHMWNNTLFEPIQKNPDLVSVYVPEWPERKIIMFPLDGVSYILGTDYLGESKKSFLRMAMYRVKQRGGLGLHAGSKVLKVKNKQGNIEDVGFIMFGLSGTGKTTLTIHDHDLQEPEKAIIRQDDVVFMDESGACYGSENGFFIKTAGLDESQAVLFKAATSPNSVFENVKIDEDKKIDFFDETLTSNGRGVVLRNEIENTDDSINLNKANHMIFITRRKDIVPVVARLTPEMAKDFFMLGESIETSAGDPSKAGQSKRCVGTNPFIVGKEYKEGEKIAKILGENPDMQAYILNTGSIGANKENPNGKKISIKVSTTIMKEIARGDIEWVKDNDFGYEVPAFIKGIDIKEYDPKIYYTKEEYQEKVNILKDERVKWLNKYEMDKKAQLVMA